MKIKSPEFNQRRAYKAYAGIIMDLLEIIGNSRALALAISFRYNNFESVDISLLSDPDDSDTIDYLRSAQAVALFKKSTYLTGSNSLDSEAKVRFFEIEEELKEFNLGKEDFSTTGIYYTASRIIRSILGPLPELQDLKVSYTSGATFSLRVSDATIAAKLSDRLDVTPLAKPYLLKWLGVNETLFRAYQDKPMIEVRGNSFSTVPKDFRKVRTICKEPLGNMLLQRSYGLFIRDRLKRVHIYIGTGQSDHRALLEHDQDCWSTIDQSDASDRISIALVKRLLPPEWFDVLNRIRSRETEIDGVWHPLEKFMTQGNGFTFELETLIFYALIQAMHINIHGSKTVVSVYGDDVIVPIHHGKTVVEFLPYFGLSVNTEKSFVGGPFKESCGFDTLRGKSVRPFYLKEFEPHEILYYVQFCNYIRNVINHLNNGVYSNPYMWRPWVRCLSYLTIDTQLFGPPSLGDNVIITDRKPEGYKLAYWKNSILYITVYKREYKRDEYVQPRGEFSELAYALLNNNSRGCLKRDAVWELTSARACPVNWT